MERCKSKVTILKTLAPVMAALIIVMGERGYCQSQGYALMVQKTPVDAGAVTPQVGIHKRDLNEVVTLKATPKPGYWFVYWLGDVSNPTTHETTILVDAPKIVIAVFERAEYELPIEKGEMMSGSGRGGMHSTGNPIRGGRGGGGGGRGGIRRPRREPPKSDFPVANEQDFPVPVPEPGTIVVFGLGAVSMFVTRRPKKTTA